MKNIRRASVVPAVVISINNEEITLKQGDVVKIITDKTDFDEIYEGEIVFINEDCIRLDTSEQIAYNYIEEIEIIEE